MVDGIKGGVEVKKDEDGEGSSVGREKNVICDLFKRAVSVVCLERKPD